MSCLSEASTVGEQVAELSLIRFPATFRYSRHRNDRHSRDNAEVGPGCAVMFVAVLDACEVAAMVETSRVNRSSGDRHAFHEQKTLVVLRPIDWPRLHRLRREQQAGC